MLNQDTGYLRGYGRNTYVYYDRSVSTYFLVPEFREDLDAKEGVLTVEVNGDPAAFAFSALTEQAEIGGERITFENRDGGIVDVGTGSTWNVLGQAVDGSMAREQLEAILSGSHFWFARAVFMLETRVILESDASAS